MKHKIKRRHTEKHPAVFTTENGKIRNEILPFIYNKDNQCSIDEYHNYCDSVKTKLGLSYSPKHWFKRYPKYVKTVKKSDGDYLKLTRLGKNFVKIVILGD